MPDLSHIRSWVFDLDNTLYSAASGIFLEMDARMADYIATYLGIAHADALGIQKRYYETHGTTLKGLMLEHGMQPDAFLHHVHDVDLSSVEPCARLRSALADLPGRKYVYTNGSRRHAERVTRQLGIDHLFDGMSGIDCGAYVPKPEPAAYDRFCDRHAVTPSDSVFFEDLSRNLEPAHRLGFTTVLVRSGGDWSHEPEAIRPGALPSGDNHAAVAHIHYVTDDLAGFLMAATTETKDNTS